MADPAFLDLVADHVAERLVDQLGLEPEPGLMDASEAAEFLGIDAGPKPPRAGTILLAGLPGGSLSVNGELIETLRLGGNGAAQWNVGE